MSSIVIIRLLKTSILLGLCLIVTGHGLIVSSYFTNQFGIKGIITAAACIAIGVILSLPTKIYLTILLGSVDLSGLKFVQTRGDLIAARGL
jgi:membrane-bound ClpP family serine protease